MAGPSAGMEKLKKTYIKIKMIRSPTVRISPSVWGNDPVPWHAALRTKRKRPIEKTRPALSLPRHFPQHSTQELIRWLVCYDSEKNPFVEQLCHQHPHEHAVESVPLSANAASHSQRRRHMQSEQSRHGMRAIEPAAQIPDLPFFHNHPAPSLQGPLLTVMPRRKALCPLFCSRNCISCILSTLYFLHIDLIYNIYNICLSCRCR